MTTEHMEHPMLCIDCGSKFDAWMYSLPQRERGRVRCFPCREGARLRVLPGARQKH